MTLLRPGDQFPDLTVTPPGGPALQLPQALSGHFGVVLFYRGAWCPYCNAQLRAFERAHDSLAELNAAVVALSVEDETTTKDLIAGHGLSFPVLLPDDVVVPALRRQRWFAAEEKPRSAVIAVVLGLAVGLTHEYQIAA